MYPKPTRILPPVLGVLISLLLVLLSFAVSEAMVHPEQTAKTFAFLYSFAGIAPLFVIQLLWRKGRFAIRITMIDFVLALLFGYMLINRYLLQDMYSFSFRFYELLGLAVLYVIIRQIDARYYSWFLLALVGSGILQAVYGNLQLYGYYPSHHPNFALTGSFFNPGPYGGFLATVFPAALGLYLFRNVLFPKSSTRNVLVSSDTVNLGEAELSGPQPFPGYLSRNVQALFGHVLPLAAVAAILLVLPATQSRAGILAVVISTVYLLGHRYNVKRLLLAWLNTPLKKLLSLTLLVIVLVGGLAAAYWVKRDSADGRILIWQVSGQMIQSRPVTGLGFDRFKAGYMEAQADWFRDHPDTPFGELADNIKYAFNDFLHFTTEQGLIGLALLIFLGILLVRVTSKTNVAWLTISKAGVLAILVFGLFSYPAQILPIKVSLMLFLAIIASCGQTYTIRFPAVPRWITLGIKGSTMALFLWGIIQVTMHIRGLHNASKQWKSGLDLYNRGGTEQAITIYEAVYPAFDRNGNFLMNYGKALSMAEADPKAIDILRQAKQHLNNIIIQTALGDSYKNLEKYEKAEQAYQLASYMLPDRFYPQYLLVKLYDVTGQRKKLIPIATKLLHKEPKIKSTAVEEIKQEIKKILISH